MSHTFIQAQHAAELSALAMAAHAVLCRASAEQPDVVSMAIDVAFEGPHAFSVVAELRDSQGMVCAGFSL